MVGKLLVCQTLLTLSTIRASDRNYPVNASARLKIPFSPDDCNIQRQISSVVSTCLELVIICNSGLRAVRGNPKNDWNYPVLPYGRD